MFKAGAHETSRYGRKARWVYLNQTKGNDNMYSERDKRGNLYVDCTECDRGFNGTDDDKCSCGQKIKKPNCGGCFNGIILEELRQEAGLED